MRFERDSISPLVKLALAMRIARAADFRNATPRGLSRRGAGATENARRTTPPGSVQRLEPGNDPPSG